jgi:inner membrane protein
LDSLTQALLGGAVSYCVAGKQSPRKAILYGAALGTLPDLDIIVQHSNDLARFTLHRSWSHSWLVQTAITPLLAWIAHKLDKNISYKTWLLMIWLCWITHSGLDAMTVYGTQLFWPFMPSPVSIGSIFIIDPLYTLPLLFGFLFILFKPNVALSKNTMLFGVIVSSAYLVWSLSAQAITHYKVITALNDQGINYEKIKVTASPFNTLLWRVIVIEKAHYYEAFSSLLDPSAYRIEFKKYLRNPTLLSSEQSADLKQLAWFTDDFYALDKQNDLVFAKDLRMGTEPNYIFSFKFAEIENGNLKLVTPSYMPRARDLGQLKDIWQRVWSPY